MIKSRAASCFNAYKEGVIPRVLPFEVSEI